MAYIKHTMKEVSLATIDGLLTEWQDEIPWLYHAYTSGSNNETITFGLRDPENPDTPPATLPFHITRYTSGSSTGQLGIIINYNNSHSTVKQFYTPKCMYDGFSDAWFDDVYITDNFIVFTSDHASSGSIPNWQNIMFVIAKTSSNLTDICIVPDIALESSSSWTNSAKGAVGIHYTTEKYVPIPTKDNDYSQTDRLGKKTILVPIILNDPNNMIARDVYAVTGKEYPSYLDLLDISDHHFLTNGRIACQLD